MSKVNANNFIAFGTKAETLERLRPALNYATVLELFKFSVADWHANKVDCLNKAQKSFTASVKSVVIRSSALSEDSYESSNAGKFASCLDIAIDNESLLEESIHHVIDSFGKSPERENQIFIQPFLKDVLISGVIFTRDLDTFAPYYVINYDDTSHTTDSVTSGRSNDLKTRVIFRDYLESDLKFRYLIKAVREVEERVQCDYLDVEFAIDSNGQVYILQARPLATQNQPLAKSETVGHYLRKIYKKFDKINNPHPYLYGERTFLGVMPDWNPAEMLGVKPRPLALSLYKELITDRTWAHQRDNYGYKKLRSYPLLITLIGHPYIDVRVSFNSFIPKDLSDELSTKLCNYYLDQLEKTPSSHDKVEFDILLSCFFFNLDEQLEKLRNSGFTESETLEIRKALFSLTNKIVSPKYEFLKKDLAKISELEVRQTKVLGSKLTNLEKIYWLVEDCRRYGTLPFAGLARAGFIAVQLLRSMVGRGWLSETELEDYMGSLTTVAKQMARDKIEMTQCEFLEKYGHLRPGTYDILSKTYAEAYDTYFGRGAHDAPESTEKFELPNHVLSELDRTLKKEGFEVSADELLDFLKVAIEGREYAKFVFTKSVSETLRLVEKLAGRYEISKEDASYLNVRTLLQLYSTLDHRDLEEILREEVDRNKSHDEITKYIRLPSLLLEPKDVYEFELDAGMPNYVTLGRIEAEVVAEQSLLSESLAGKIILIKSADPGYDWLFTKKIAGLVTMYGGANSHMAIRCAELRIPAVIGAGEKFYNEWNGSEILEIDCVNKQVRIIK